MDHPTGRRPIVGFLLNSVFNGYEAMVWKYVIRAAAELDVDLLCFLGGAIGEEWRRRSTFDRSSLFSLVRPENVDAAVMLTPSVSHLSGPAGAAALVPRLAPIPVVSLSEPLAGVSSVSADGAAGIALAVAHLVAHHGRRRIAFVGGPAHSREAALRFEAYRAALGRYGLALDPALLVDGDWSPDSGTGAIRTLAERGAAYDALLASNDLMALSALDELRRRGVDVPGQVAVCGFDDVADAPSAAPPLTTVRQPFAEMVRLAMRRALALARGEAVGPDGLVPTELVTRRSCGCPGAIPRTDTVVRDPGAPAPEGLRRELEAAFPGFGASAGVPGWAAELSEALATAEPARAPALLHALESLVTRSAEVDPDPSEWFRVLGTAIALAAARAPAEAERLAALREAAYPAIASASAGAQVRRRGRAEYETRVLHRLVQPFPFPEDAFVRNLIPALEVLGVRSFFLARYVDPALREAALVVHHDLDGVAELDGRATFAPRELIPGRFTGDRRRAHAVLPIESPDGPIGFAVCEVGSINGYGYEVLMDYISTVFSTSRLVAKLREQQHQLVDTARQAGMAEFAVGTLHNVGNVLNTVSVCAEQIAGAAGAATVAGLGRALALVHSHRDDLPGFFARDPRAPLLAEYLGRAGEQLAQERAAMMGEAQLLLEKVQLARDTIRGLHDLARDGHGPLLPERLDLRALVSAAVHTQGPLLERHGVVVEEDGAGEAQAVVSDRSKLLHVLVNLVKNAVEAMRDAAGGRRVLRVAIEPVGAERVCIRINDSGKGIDPRDLDKLFSFGFTTKPDGHGFGLHTCAVYAKQLGGSISASSPGPDRGATFTVELPREPAAGSPGRS